MHYSDASSMQLGIQNHQQLRLQKLFSVLSNKDSLRVFEMASQGVIASSDALQKMKISRAQYYRKLAQLINLGLIRKDDQGTYSFTLLGEIVYQNQVLTLRRIAADTNLFDTMVKFDLKNRSSNKNFENVVREITRDVIAKNDPGLWSLSQLRLFETIEQYFSIVITLSSNAKNELYLVARNLELPMIDALITAAERSVKINLIYTDWKGYYSNSDFDPLDELLIEASKKHPSAVKLFRSDQAISVKRVEVHYGFVVSDNQHVALEIADPEDRQSFYGGIGLESGLVAKKLIAYYSKLAQKPELTRRNSF